MFRSKIGLLQAGYTVTQKGSKKQCMIRYIRLVIQPFKEKVKM